MMRGLLDETGNNISYLAQLKSVMPSSLMMIEAFLSPSFSFAFIISSRSICKYRSPLIASLNIHTRQTYHIYTCKTNSLYWEPKSHSEQYNQFAFLPISRLRDNDLLKMAL